MRTISYKSLLDNVAGLYGEAALGAEDSRLVAASLNSDRLNEVWTYADWRELEVIEERFFAADYAGDTAYVQGNIVYWAATDSYYEALGDTTGNLPNDTGFWKVSSGHKRVIDFTQLGKTQIGVVQTITRLDPRLHPNSERVQFVKREQAVQVINVSGSSVWVRFTRREPRVTAADYDATTTYALGAVVYDSASGECYESLEAANVGNGVDDINKWSVQLIPYFAASFLTRAVLADLHFEHENESRGGRCEARAYERLSDAYATQFGQEGQVTRAEVMMPTVGSVTDVVSTADLVTTNNGNELEVE